MPAGRALACAILLSSPLWAQAQRFDCTQTRDPKACEERVSRMKAAYAEAQKACAGKSGAGHRECVLQHTCARQRDPKACEERAARIGERRQAQKACEGKSGAERDECMAKHLCAQAKDAAKCEAQARSHLARRDKLRETCKEKRGEQLRACIGGAK